MGRKRIVIAVLVIVLIAGIVLGIDFWQRSQAVDLAPGSVPIYVGERLVGGFVPDDLAQLSEVSFTDEEEGKEQRGWLLGDVLRLHVDPETLEADTEIIVSSSSREKSATVTWGEVEDEGNMVMFDLSGRGTLKLVARQGSLRARETWVQDADRIHVR